MEHQWLDYQDSIYRVFLNTLFSVETTSKSDFLATKTIVVYPDKLKRYSKQYSVAVHSFVLMTNHVHLLVTPDTEHGVSQMMQALGRDYVRYINQTFERTGTLWEG